jgi:hypothetical protein
MTVISPKNLVRFKQLPNKGNEGWSNMSIECPQLRMMLSDAFGTVVVVLVILTLLGGWFTYTTHVTSATHSEERVVAAWESNGTFDHSATVTNGSEAFPAGTTLSNQSVYFTSIVPVLNGSFTYTYDAATGDITSNTTLLLVLHSVEETRGENATEYWRITRTLDTQQTDSLTPGEPQRVVFSVDMNATQQRADQIEEEIGGSPGTVEASIVARTTINGTIENISVSRTQRYELPIEFSDGRYAVRDTDNLTDRSEVTRQVAVPTTHGPLRSTGSVFLFLFPLWTLIGLASARWQGVLDVDENERARLETQAASTEFDEWITTARLPDTVLDVPHIQVDSLEGLVDVAIDTNQRVIEDPDRKKYFVLGDHACYTFSHDSKD